MKILFYFVLKPFLLSLSILPMRFLYLLSDALFLIIFYIFKYRRKVVQRNLNNSFPEYSKKKIATIERQFYHHFTDLIVEVIKMFTISEKEAREKLIVRNPELLDNYFKQGKTVLIYTSHYGNWEYGSFAKMWLKYPLSAVYKPLNNPYFDEWMIKVRSQFSSVMVPMKSVNRKLVELRHAPHAMIFIADQTPMLGDARYFLKFLNQDTAVFQGVEKIARRTNYPVFCCHFNFVKRGHYETEIVLLSEKPQDLPENKLTEAYYKLLEDKIKVAPQYWLWSHNRWKFSIEDAPKANK